MNFYARYPSSGVSTFPSFATLPASSSNGTLAVTLDTDDLYIFNGSIWELLASPGGGGGVTAVTASSPLASSGGTAPNITIQQADGSHNGYLSSADWTTFNNKQPAGSYALTDLSNLASTAVNASIIPALANTIDAGSGALPFQSVFAGTTFDLGNNNLVSTLTNNSTFWGPIPAVVINSELNNGGVVMFGSTDTVTPGVATAQAALESGDNNALSGPWSTTGHLYLETGYQNTPTSTGATGQIFVLTGNAALGNTGDITITSGDSSGGNSGNIQIHTGSAGGTKGQITLISAPLNMTGDIVPTSNNSYNLGDINHLWNVNFFNIIKSANLQNPFNSQTDISTNDQSGASSQPIVVHTGSASGGGHTSGLISFTTGGASSGATRGAIQFNAPQAILETCHFTSNQSGSTTVAPNANAGTGAASSLSNATDNAGHLSLTTGTAAWASGIQTTVSFMTAYGVAPTIQITPTNANAAAAFNSRQVFISSTQSGFSINFGVADTAQLTYTWDYLVVETQ